jgi:pyruvate kinase
MIDALPVNRHLRFLTHFLTLPQVVKKGDTIFVGQYLFTGSETTSVWLEVEEIRGDDVIGVCKNAATLQGALLTAHCACVRVGLPILSAEDKKNISTWGQANQIDFVSLSFTRSAEDVREVRGPKVEVFICVLVLLW